MGTYTGTSEDDVIIGSSSADYISGGPYNGLGEDFLVGGDGNDTLYGGVESDYLSGGAGDDTFIVKGVDGWDIFDGGAGTDVISIEDVSPYAFYSLLKIESMSGIERIVNADTKDAVIEFNGSIDLSSVELVGIDEIRGNDGGSDTVWGSQGNDYLLGQAGDDVLEGEGGNDILAGGEGADVFVFRGSDGNDTITDFTDDLDIIRFINTSASDVSDLTITDNGGDALISIDDIQIRLENFNATNLTNADFDFM